MPLAREVEYWDGVAKKTVSDGNVYDNSWKRPHQIRRLLDFDWIEEKVLEIGCGNGIVAGALRLMLGNHWSYTGTDLSDKFREAVKSHFLLNTVQADVTELPGEGYTRIIAFDSLEHVRPEHRKKGYERMYQVAASGALLFIHYSYSTSYHDKEFDHPFGLSDLVALEEAGFSLVTFDRYKCKHPSGEFDYAFAVMRK